MTLLGNLIMAVDELTCIASMALNESARVKRVIADTLSADIALLAERIIDTYRGGGRSIVFGNGGSAADAMHLSAELLGRYDRNRRPLPALALTADPATLTCIANDFGFENVFERQIEAHATRNDIAIGITTSGRSRNIIAGLRAAKTKGCYTVALTGRDGGEVLNYADLSIVVPSESTARIQEAHATIIHILSEMIDQWLTSSEQQ